MKRAELESFIMETYNAEADYPWLKYPNYEVFRHCNNRKWFALIKILTKKLVSAIDRYELLCLFTLREMHLSSPRL